MLRTLKISMSILALCLVLGISMIVALIFFINPNDYKKELEQLATDHGAELSIKGDLAWSFYPKLGIQSGALSIKPPSSMELSKSLSQPIGFTSMKVSTQLMPLLQGEVITDQVQIDGGDFTLLDTRTNTTTVIKNLMLSTQGFNLNEQPFELNLSMNMSKAQDNKVIQTINLNSEMTLSIDKAMQNVSISKSKHDIGLSAEALGNKPSSIHAEFPAEINLETQNAQLKNLKLKLDESQFTGSIDANFSSTPFYNIILSGDTLDADRYTPLPKSPEISSKTEKPDEAEAELIPAASVLAFPGSYAISLQKLNSHNLQVSNIEVALDITPQGLLTLHALNAKIYDASLKLQASIDASLTEPTVSFSANLSPIQIEPVLKNFLQTDSAPAVGDLALNTNLRAKGITQKQLMDSVNGTVQITSKNITANHLKMSNLNAIFQLSPMGLITVKQVKSQLYQGELSMKGLVNIAPKKPVISMDVSLSPIQLEPALKDYLQKDKVFASGDFAFEGKFSGSGINAEELIQGLDGNIVFNSKAITLNQVDLTSSLDATLLQLLQMKLPKITNGENKSVLTELTGKNTISKGIVKNTELKAKALCTQFDGNGQVDLNQSTVQYQMGILFPSTDTNKTCADINSRLKDIAWPVLCQGSLAGDASKLCKADTGKIQSMIASAAKKEVGQKLEKKADEQLKKKLGEEGGDQVKQLLKGFLH